jgi:hypothetical protein
LLGIVETVLHVVRWLMATGRGLVLLGGRESGCGQQAGDEKWGSEDHLQSLARVRCVRKVAICRRSVQAHNQKACREGCRCVHVETVGWGSRWPPPLC